ncbi:hypothetical protein G7Z17_g11399 [Cylindrodendrum hubeiense]|uniref:SMP-30/Gluconolactonase/LRE-like region domain-containing protein n=1 Tax=Cylindrodendrum hubeiense TaxID=595255 RepID=A0A9P5L6E4_9HYPO|nr:hypothetical protein G7Z17_g11399 [Cylindrodendrum hubeiense]
MFCKSLLSAVALAAVTLAKTSPAETLDELSLGTWLENIAVRPNGDILATQMFPSAIIYTIKNPTKKPHTLEQLVDLPAIQNIYGIAQVPTGPDSERYVVVGSNGTTIANPTVGTFSAWTIDLVRDSRCGKTKVKKVSSMFNDSRFLNGVTEIPGVSNAVLVGDSTNGNVGHLDLKTGKFDTSAFVFPEMDPTEAVPFGVNGIHIHNGYLYFTNSATVSIFRIAITPRGYPAKGAKVELVINLSSKASFVDDFAFDADGNIYAATNFDNSVISINLKTLKVNTIVGGVDELTVAGSTAVAFGRGKHDKETLYVATGGALAAPVGGTKTEGAKVVAVDTDAN